MCHEGKGRRRRLFAEFLLERTFQFSDLLKNSVHRKVRKMTEVLLCAEHVELLLRTTSFARLEEFPRYVSSRFSADLRLECFRILWNNSVGHVNIGKARGFEKCDRPHLTEFNRLGHLWSLILRRRRPSQNNTQWYWSWWRHNTMGNSLQEHPYPAAEQRHSGQGSDER